MLFEESTNEKVKLLIKKQMDAYHSCKKRENTILMKIKML